MGEASCFHITSIRRLAIKDAKAIASIYCTGVEVPFGLSAKIAIKGDGSTVTPNASEKVLNIDVQYPSRFRHKSICLKDKHFLSFYDSMHGVCFMDSFKDKTRFLTTLARTLGTSHRISNKIIYTTPAVSGSLALQIILIPQQ